MTTQPAGTTVHSSQPYNAEPPRTALADRDLTPVDAFYHRNHAAERPRLDPATWALRVDGMVERPATFSLDALRERFREHSEVVTLQCAGNRRAGLMEVADPPGETPWGPGATGTARWAGVRLADVLREAGVAPGATDVAFTGADVAEEADEPYAVSVPLEKALADEVLLAWSMNDAPLPSAHGAPVRVVVPGWIGARSVKWLERVTVADEPSRGHFQAVAYRLLPADDAPAPGRGVALGPIAVNADVLSPADGAEVPAGPVRVTGDALAGGDRTVVRVDVSTDDGATWHEADLEPQASRWSWRHWHTTLDLPAGTTRVVARAWDSAAGVQPADPAELWNPKGYVNNSWARVTLHAVASGGG
ncbi:sulfite oxidase [Actinomycetospora aeridis]|uniref:Sulfite oxidase n=1 Tax=Actinomycetospora aeridis TaxID=3129231 RepID=A0ABU8N0M4_9PSEU